MMNSLICSAINFGFYTEMSIVWLLLGFKRLGVHQQKNMPMRSSNTQQALFGSAWTGLHERGSLSQYETVTL